MVKIIASYYKRIPLKINGKDTYGPHKNFLSSLKFADITIRDDLYKQIISDDDIYVETIYDKDDPDNNFFKTKCLSRSNMNKVILRCDECIKQLVTKYAESSDPDKITIIELIKTLSYVRELVYKVYKANTNYYIELIN
jgi:hypothetical protein